MIRFVIELPPVTKKNSQRIMVNKKTGRPFIKPSKSYEEYEKAAGYFLRGRGLKINYPVNVKAIYYMKARYRVDLINLHEALHDVLVKYEVLEDDNAKIVVSTDGSRVEYDKERPRTEVIIERRT